MHALVVCVFSLASIATFAHSTSNTQVVATTTAAQEAQGTLFEFHNAFLMNLHHFLHRASVSDEGLEKVEWTTQPSADELETLSAAMRFYQRQYAGKDLLFDEELSALIPALAVGDEVRHARGLRLPSELIDQLEAAAPIYEKCLWPSHHAHNDAWIEKIKSLDSRYGTEVRAGI
jgi:hypothetical protein